MAPPLSSSTPRRRDSQLNRQPSLTKGSRAAPVANSTPHTDRSEASSPSVSQAADSKGKTPAAAAMKAQHRQRAPSTSSDVRSNSGRSTPASNLREQLTSQAEQLASQTEKLASQTEKLASQTEQLSTQTEQLAVQDEKIRAQEEQLASQGMRISRLTLQAEEKQNELGKTRSQLREAVYSFDIMAIVCQSLGNQEEEARGEMKFLSSEYETVCGQLDQSVEELTAAVLKNEALDEQLSLEYENHKRGIEELASRHKSELKSEKAKLKEEKETAVKKVIEQHSAEVKTLKRYHDKEVDTLGSHAEMRMKELKADYEMRLHRNHKIYENELTELQHQHEKKVAEITQRFEEMKVALTERVQSLSAEGSDLRTRASQHEEHVRRNSDFKLQSSPHKERHFGFMSLSASSSCLNDNTLNGRFGLASSEMAIQQFQHLPEENASLKAVLDLRINENAELRRQNTELQGKLTELEEAREKQNQLLRQIENLEAIISLKTDNEKQLHDKHQQLLRRYERESKEKKRLSMGYEELLYKLEERQSTDDLTKSSLSDIPSMTSSAVIMRPKPDSTPRPRHRGLQHDRSKRRTIASSRELDS